MSAWDRQTTVASSQDGAIDQGLRSYMLKVYNYMASGVLLTAIVAYFAGTSPAFMQMLVTVGPDGAASISPLFWIIALAPAAMGFFVLPRIQNMSESNAKLTFWVYAGIMGLSLSSIFMIYTEASILRVLLVTAGTFGLLSIYGYSTKRDLSGMRTFITVGVIAMFFTSLLNGLVFKSTGLNVVLPYLGVLLALGMTMYYTQQTKNIYYAIGRNGGLGHATIIAALNLYFAFVYLFINLMQIMGNRR